MRGRPFCNPWYFSIITRKAKVIDVPHQLLKECYVQLYTTRTINTFTRVKARNKSTVWQMDLSVRWGFTLKLVRDMIIIYSQMHRKDKYSQQSSIIWPVWQNILVFVYELSGCGFETRCCHLNFRYGTCFEHGVPWHSGKLYGVDSSNFFELGLSVSQWWFPKQNGFILLSLKSLSYILTSPYALYLCLR